MPRSQRAPFRALRTLVGSAVVLGLGIAAHLSAGGSIPAPLIMLGISALTVLLGMIISRWRLNLLAISTVLAGSQIVLHTVFDALGGCASPGISGQGMNHHYGGSFIMPEFGASAMPGRDSGLLMTFLHVIATAASALALGFGEKCLWALAQWLSPLWNAPRAVKQFAVRRLTGVPSVLTLPRELAPIRAHPLRGPPQISALSL